MCFLRWKEEPQILCKLMFTPGTWVEGYKNGVTTE